MGYTAAQMQGSDLLQSQAAPVPTNYQPSNFQPAHNAFTRMFPRPFGPGGMGQVMLNGTGAIDMDTLKSLVLSATPGTGEVERVIRETKFIPRHNAFTSLLQLASKSRQPEKAIEIFESMQNVAGIKPNTFSYSALISALARVGQWQQAEKYFHELLERSAEDEACKPNTVTFAALISAYEKGRQADKALKAFRMQLDAGVEPDVITFSSLISACERSGYMDKAAELLEHMHSLGLTGPPQMYVSVIAACGPQWQPALDTWLGMQCAGVEPSPQAANMLMSSLAQGGRRDDALWLLKEATMLGWTLSHSAVTALLRLLADAGDWRAADAAAARVQSTGTHLDGTCAGHIVEAHVRGDDPQGAERVREQFERLGVHPRRPDSSSESTPRSVANGKAKSDGNTVSADEPDRPAHAGTSGPKAEQSQLQRQP